MSEQIGEFGRKKGPKSGPRKSTPESIERFRDNYSNITSKCNACGERKAWGSDCERCKGTRS
jgi:hypothetical protein